MVPYTPMGETRKNATNRKNDPTTDCYGAAHDDLDGRFRAFHCACTDARHGH